MIVTLKLFATLAAHLPPEARKAHQAEAEVEEGTSVRGLIDRFRVPPTLCTLVLVNGHFIPQDGLDAKVLVPGDVVAIWPPVGGG